MFIARSYQSGLLTFSVRAVRRAADERFCSVSIATAFEIVNVHVQITTIYLLLHDEAVKLGHAMRGGFGPLQSSIRRVHHNYIAIYPY